MTVPFHHWLILPLKLSARREENRSRDVYYRTREIFDLVLLLLLRASSAKFNFSLPHRNQHSIYRITVHHTEEHTRQEKRAHYDHIEPTSLCKWILGNWIQSVDAICESPQFSSENFSHFICV